MMAKNDPIRNSVVVAAPPERAFVVFTDELVSWWPKEFTWAGDVLETIVIEPREGGRCFERGPHGFELDWGRVLVCDPPHRLVITWQISFDRQPVPDPARASEVEVNFVARDRESTRVDLEHRKLAKHGENSGKYRAALGSPRGWPYILDCYVSFLDRE
jgi:uncharacterized protein YndB with AHSA1/START domain